MRDKPPVPEPLPLTLVHGGEVYLRIVVKGTTYRWVSSFFSNDTPSGSFRILPGNGDD